MASAGLPARERRTLPQVRLERAGDRADRRHHARATLPAGPDVRRAHAGLPAAPAARVGSPAVDESGSW